MRQEYLSRHVRRQQDCISSQKSAIEVTRLFCRLCHAQHLLRLQPGLGDDVRTQFAEQAIELIYQLFRLGRLQTELEHAARRKLRSSRLRDETGQPLRLNRSLL